MYNKNYEQYANIAKQAESLDQLQAAQRHIANAIQSDVLKPYEGIPLVQDLTGRIKQAQAAQQAMMLQQFAPPMQQAPQGQPAAPIASQVMAQAPGLQALPSRQSGVAALPSGINQESFAGGGIVAFAKGGQSFEDKLRELQYGPEDDEAEPERNPLFRRLYSKAFGKFPSMGSFRENLAALMPPKAAPAPTAEQTANFMGSPAPTEKGVEFDPTAGGTYTPKEVVKPEAVIAKAAPKPAVAPVPEAASQAAPQESPEQIVAGRFAPYEKLLQEDKEAAARNREDDKWMRIMEAGFNMMGGTSPYALTNIGQGSAQAMKGYQSDIAAARKEEADRIKSMIALGMKKEEMAQSLGLKTRELDQEMKKLGITEELYKHHGAYYDAMAKAAGARAAGIGAGAGTKMDIAKLNAIKSTFATLQKSAGDMTSPNYGKSPEELWSMAESMVTGQGGGAPAPNTISWSSLGKK